MRIHRIPKDFTDLTCNTYENVDVKDIQEAADKYGRANDTLELYDDENKLIARATWDSCYRRYFYATGEDVGTPFEVWHK